MEYTLLKLTTSFFFLLGTALRPGECGVGEIRLVGVNASQGQGELQYLYEDGEWASVCSGAVGVLDAQIACQYLGFPLLQRIGKVAE
ncbi:Galectin-3-binding protein B, partial [Geodia barretti]